MGTRAFSLIVVLVALAIMSLLLIAIFSGNTRGVRWAQNEAGLARAGMLADTAAALVEGQIEQATTPAGQAWISQPGLIRTFAASNSTRTPAACYKLYSSTQMIDKSGGVSFFATDVPADWNSNANASVYTDLNASLQTLSGTALYPILDAQAVASVTGLSSDTGHAVEMPVAWLYQLQDGTLGPASAATAANPILGRVAFWTDDETSKIDLDTAGVASPWNVPCTTSPQDAAWSTMQPASGEFERYPGHPAGVSLEELFPSLTGDQLLALTPRYDAGGSEFGTQTTTSTSAVPLKMNRLYASVDELCFGPGFTSSGQRSPTSISPSQIEQDRFVLTVHSHAPETTLLGEPRVAIWPVSAAPSDSTRTTAADRAVASDAVLGTTSYYFQRHDAASATADLDPTVSTASAANFALFSNLVAAGSEQLPGNASTFAQKYPGTQWPQVMVEILDAIRGFNAIDPAAGSASAPTSFVPFAAGDSTGVGRGLIVPLTTTTTGGTTLRGLGRYPTLSGLTLVLYVSGYGFNDGTSVDYETTPDADGSNWRTNFPIQKPPASRWSSVNKELVRAFIVPTTFQPNCGFPEVSEACSIQITGLDQLSATVKGVTTSFGFAKVCTSPLFSDAATGTSPDRVWGGFEGPAAWCASAADAVNNGSGYVFAGSKAIAVPDGTLMDSQTKGPSASYSWSSMVTTSLLKNLTVQILNRSGQTVQTLSVDLPALAGVPVGNGEADHADSLAKGSQVNWATNPACAVAPSYYMTLRNRLLTTPLSRALIIQAGDASLSVEPATDLRLIALLPSVPDTFFHQATTTRTTASVTGPAATLGYHYHNLRFADGTSASFVGTQMPVLAGNALVAKTSGLTVTEWDTGGTLIYPWETTAAVSAPLGANGVTMTAIGGSAAGPAGDWDTGPGLEPDGALTRYPDAGTTLDPAVAYQSLGPGQMGAATRRSPNALIPSPIVFGSVPAGVNPAQPAQSVPWRTLLFCPYPSADQNHPGLASPPDYLVLDHFWMPVIEPYGISGPFETTGKINLNDQIAPFTYLHRNAALHALLHGLRIPAISANDAGIAPASGGNYKILPATAGFQPWRTVNENATIAQIESRLSAGDVYLTEGEICSVPLIPDNLGSFTPESYWTSRSGPGFLTGDNLRELPYAQLYGRLTTRSNSYTVHIRAQVLQKLRRRIGSAECVEARGSILCLAIGADLTRSSATSILRPRSRQSRRATARLPTEFRIVSAPPLHSVILARDRLRASIGLTRVAAALLIRACPDLKLSSSCDCRTPGRPRQFARSPPGDDVIVQAPTGAGKTFIFEQYLPAAARSRPGDLHRPDTCAGQR